MTARPYHVVAGCGYLGRRLATALAAGGGRVTAIVRSEASREVLCQAGIDAVSCDLGEVGAMAAVPGIDTGEACLYYLVPPPSTGRHDSHIGRFLASIDPRRLPRRIVLLSTTAVYGNAAGAWVDETTPPRPATDRGHRRLDAESRLTHWAETTGVSWIILRVPGIYGPGRLPVERIRARLPVLHANESPWSNRIHVDDLVTVCLAASKTPHDRRIFVVADDEPMTMTEFFMSVADHLGLDRPPEVGLDEARNRLSPAMLSYLSASRRIDNRRMKSELGVCLRYPGLALGLVRGCGAGDDIVRTHVDRGGSTKSDR